VLVLCLVLVVLAVIVAHRLRRYCRHCHGLGKVRRGGLRKPKPCRRCHGTGLSPRRRRAELLAMRDPIHRTGDPIAAYRRRTTTEKEGADR
jgi:type II secretory ATPase GspE/PulE/Tfp pilus assembly ATPase PilB-like protein